MTETSSVDADNLHARDPDDAAAALMMRFAERAGLTSGSPGRCYLWTDAFAVCNFLGLARSTGAANYARLALELVDRVRCGASGIAVQETLSRQAELVMRARGAVARQPAKNSGFVGLRRR